MESLKNQIAAVTGASSGIGKAIALSLAAQGAELCLAARRKEQLEMVVKEAQALGAHAHACPVDLTKDEDIHALGEKVQREFGRLHILVLCGGAIAHGAQEKAIRHLRNGEEFESCATDRNRLLLGRIPSDNFVRDGA